MKRGQMTRVPIPAPASKDQRIPGAAGLTLIRHRISTMMAKEMRLEAWSIGVASQRR
jgi:hypothetical protein